MLSDYQILVVRRALAQAKDKDAEIKRLAKGMQVKESEIRIALDQMSQTESVTSASKGSTKETAGRLVWTTRQLEQLYRLRAEGKGPAEIARIMGLKAHQVQSRLHSEKKSQSSKSAAPVEDVPPATPPGPEPAASELESQVIPVEPAVETEIPEPAPALLPEAVRSFGELARKIFSPDSEKAEEPDAETFPVSGNSPFILASEIMSLIKYLEYSYPPVSMGLLQANQEAGWATCHFSAAGSEYVISLRRKEKTA